MIINLDENHRAETDPMNWKLQRRHVAQKGEHAGRVTWSTLGYYSTLGALVAAAARRDIRVSTAETVVEAIEQIEALREKFDALGEALREDVTDE